MFKIAVSFSGGGSGNKKRVCHKSHPIRPERAEALSPGHRPGFLNKYNKVALKGQKLSNSKLLPFLLYLHLEK